MVAGGEGIAMDAAAGNHRLTDKRRALVALRRMQERLDAADRSRREPIAIVGMSCRFPGEANSLEAFWDLLRAGRCAVTKVPSDRWDADALFDSDPSAPGKICSRYGSFVNDADCFDASFFGISGREAISMDPQQRLLLEVIWEALENAGLAPDRLAGTRTAVYTGICFNDYGRRHFFSGDVRRIDPWCGTGIAGSVASGRVSYVLGLRGPNLPVDTACSSSLVAVHLACQSLRLGEADVALAAGVNLLLSPEPSIYFTKVGALAPDGLSKTFDAAADGYGRGEGCAAVVLKRVSDAVSAGDAVLAVIRGSAVNHDGRTAGLTVPNGLAQKEVIAAALNAAQVEPGCVDYIEAHGTGTFLGDPIEMHALYESLVAGVRRDRRLLVGSVKTNIGHLEAAAGLAGLIKSVLALRHAEIPPHLHLRRLNPEIAAHAPDIDIPTTRTPWLGGSRPKMAGVSAFGFSGTNAHVLLEEAPARQSVPDRAVGLLVFSAKTKPALDELRRRYIELLGRTPSGDWPAICQSAALRRSHFPHRIAVMARSGEEALQQLLGTPAPPSDTCDEPVLAAARRYLQGEPVEWSQVFGATPYAVVTVPNYPFQRERYWLDPPNTSNSNGHAPPSHELLGRRLRSPLKQVQFESQINAGNPAWLADHRVFGEVILPASAYLEMAVHAAAECQEIGRSAEVSVSHLRLLEPLRVPAPGGESVAMQLVEDAGAFRIFSLGPGERREWVVHAEGNFSSPDALDPAVTGVKVAAIQERCPTWLDRDDFYAELRARGLQYGKQFQRIERLWLGRGEVLAQLVPDETPSLFRVHPAMLDAGLQALYANTEPHSGGCYVPVGFETVRSFAAVQGPCWCHATVGEGGIGELRLFSDDGTPLLQISGARFQLVDATWLQRTKSSVPTSDFYQSRWIEQPPAASVGVSARWLVVGSSDAAAADVASQLATAGCDALPARDGTIDTALAEIESAGGDWGCVFVGHAGSVPDLETTTGEEILDHQQIILGGLLRVTRELLRKRLDSRWRGLWVVTSRAQCVGENERTQDLEAASLWGFRRSIAAENPELRARAVDLDGLNSCAALTRELTSELSSDDQIAFRGSRRFVMRLLQAPVEVNSRAVRLELAKVGQLDSLRISPAARHALG
jgi:acyl transferase domain-containing protein